MQQMQQKIQLLWANRPILKQGIRMQKHCHSCYQLYYVMNGNATFYVNEKKLSVNPGDCFIIPPFIHHSMDAISKSELICYELKFIMNDSFFTSFLLKSSMIFHDEGYVETIFSYIFKNWTCHDEQNLENIRNIMYSVIIRFFISKLNYTIKSSQYLLTDEYSDVTKAILVYIEQNYTRPFSLGELSGRLNYNKNYLCCIFRKNTGRCIIDYLNFVRIRQAVIFFAFYGQNVSTTCESVGFCSPNHFSRTFKAFVGISPRNFKQAFSLLPNDQIFQYFSSASVFRYSRTTIEEAFSALRHAGQFAANILEIKTEDKVKTSSN